MKGRICRKEVRLKAVKMLIFWKEKSPKAEWGFFGYCLGARGIKAMKMLYSMHPKRKRIRLRLHKQGLAAPQRAKKRSQWRRKRRKLRGRIWGKR
jgi:hypothetical protein